MPPCHGPVQGTAVHTQYQTDLPPVRPVVTRFDIERGYCPHCRRHVQARHPEQLSDALGAAGNQIGPRAAAVAAEMNYRLGVPFRKIVRLWADYGQLPRCHGTLVRASARLARLAQPAHAVVAATGRDSPVVHGDDTGWRVGGSSAWRRLIYAGT